ncbi:MAG: hypothetical protein B6245_18060 [Desulfobacteraceae bacterium 4572_88]|nr:MAG: hypothetical protein B6245_18060 [Desulfobacteraceae bacterium 4572_88]
MRTCPGQGEMSPPGEGMPLRQARQCPFDFQFITISVTAYKMKDRKKANEALLSHFFYPFCCCPFHFPDTVPPRTRGRANPCERKL